MDKKRSGGHSKNLRCSTMGSVPRGSSRPKDGTLMGSYRHAKRGRVGGAVSPGIDG